MRHRALAAPLVALLVALLAMAPGPASAQPAETLEQARKAFAQGEEAEARGDCAAAIERYEAVSAVKETAAVRLRIGRCQERLGELRAALATYARARDLARDDPQALEVATQVESALAARVPRVEIRGTDGVTDVVVTIDGAAVRREDGPIALDPGAHTVTARAPGMKPFELAFDLAEGEVRIVELALRPTQPEPRAPEPVEPTGDGSFPWVPAALYAGAGVAVVIAIPLLVTSFSDDAELDRRCFDAEGLPSEDRDPCFARDGGPFSTPERDAFEDDRSSVNTRQGVGLALLGVGTIAAGLATVLLLTDDDGAAGRGEARASGVRLRAVVPHAGPADAGLLVQGSF